MIHYDLPAAIFFLATEFAHYPPAKTDQYGRPDEAHSFIYKNKIHSYPLLHFYADSFFEVMQRSGYSGAKKERAFSYEITLDIDQPWKYLNKGFWVNAGGFFKDFLTEFSTLASWRKLRYERSI